MSFTGKPKISLKNLEIQVNGNKCPKPPLKPGLEIWGDTYLPQLLLSESPISWSAPCDGSIFPHHWQVKPVGWHEPIIGRNCEPHTGILDIDDHFGGLIFDKRLLLTCYW